MAVNRNYHRVNARRISNARTTQRSSANRRDSQLAPVYSDKIHSARPVRTRHDISIRADRRIIDSHPACVDTVEVRIEIVIIPINTQLRETTSELEEFCPLRQFLTTPHSSSSPPNKLSIINGNIISSNIS